MLSTLFHEFQIAFRHYSIVDRYRFRVTDNLSLDFEVIGKGYFFHRVLSTPFSFLLGRWYNIKLIIYGGVYQFLVDNQIVMSVNDGVAWLNDGGLAIICYDWAGRSDIDVKIQNLCIHGE